jgi:hypothetical protein
VNFLAWTSEVVACGAAAVLWWTGAQKLVQPSPLSETLSSLFPRLEPDSSSRMARVVGLLEVCGAVCTSALGGLVGAGALVVLGTIFAAIGIYALRTGKHVSCNCFGVSRKSHKLGLRQVVSLPAWWVAAAASGWMNPPSDRSVVRLAVSVSAAATFASLRLWVALEPTRTGRLNAQRNLGGHPNAFS